jgi:hypothetical protein
LRAARYFALRSGTSSASLVWLPDVARRASESCHPDGASIASGWKDLGQRGMSTAGSGFEIAQRSFSNAADDSV